MGPFGWIVATLGALATACIVLAAAARWLAIRWHLPHHADEVHEAPTRDGWLLALYRYIPRDPAPGREPVLACHGMLSCRSSLDLDERISLALFLRDAGFDVWVMELRARGGSRRDPKAGRRRSWRRLGYDWTFDEFIAEDLPAAVRYVLRATGAGRLHWVGHSLGGMILYAHCVEGETSWFRSAVAIDSPGHFAPLRRNVWPGRVYALLIPVVPVVLFKPIFHLAYLLLPRGALWRYILLDKGTLLRILHNGLIDLGSSRVLLHLVQILSDGRFRSFDRQVDYEKGPARIRFPLMVLRAPAGRSPERCVRHAYETAGSESKEYVRCGRADGFAIDHNHFTLLIGRTAPAEIFPRIAAWLSRHSSA